MTVMESNSNAINLQVLPQRFCFIMQFKKKNKKKL